MKLKQEWNLYLKLLKEKNNIERFNLCLIFKFSKLMIQKLHTLLNQTKNKIKQNRYQEIALSLKILYTQKDIVLLAKKISILKLPALSLKV